MLSTVVDILPEAFSISNAVEVLLLEKKKPLPQRKGPMR
jgi:hypothetical protein